MTLHVGEHAILAPPSRYPHTWPTSAQDADLTGSLRRLESPKGFPGWTLAGDHTNRGTINETMVPTHCWLSCRPRLGDCTLERCDTQIELGQV